MKPKRPKPRNPMARSLHTSGAFKQRTVADKRKTQKSSKVTSQEALRLKDDDVT